jgi:hypothetical protein
MVGDGKRPNLYFGGNGDRVLALFVRADDAIAFADRIPFGMVEDRLTGVLHDSPSSLERQRVIAAAEDAAQIEGAS